jgi:YegS/Rv2252/BmrU family lipid kinase
LTDTLFIINPVSGGGAALKAWRTARPLLQNAGMNFRDHLTTCAGEAVEITRAALREGVTQVVAVGGDGTLSEIVSGYLTEDGQPIKPSATIGILPAGTGTDFCRTLGIRNSRQAIQALTGTESRVIDAGQIKLYDRDGRPYTRAFINLASFGLGGDTAMLVNRWRGGRPRLLKGRTMYALAALRALDRYRNRPVRVRLDDSPEIEIKSNLLVVANGKYAGGGMMLAPRAELDDQLFDIVLTDGASRWDIIRELPRIGRGDHLKNPRVSTQRARRVAISADEPLPIDVDGDFVGYTPAELSVLPSALRVRVTD